jgi:WD40 repeat protein
VLWSLTEKRPLAHLVANERSLQSIVFSRDGRYLATGSTDGSLRLWDVAAAISGMPPAADPAAPAMNLTQFRR